MKNQTRKTTLTNMKVELFPLMALCSVSCQQLTIFFGRLHCINVLMGVAAAQSFQCSQLHLPPLGPHSALTAPLPPNAPNLHPLPPGEDTSTNCVISNLTCVNHHVSPKGRRWQFGTGALVSLAGRLSAIGRAPGS